MKGFQFKIKINKLKIFYLLIFVIGFTIFLALVFLNIQIKKQNLALQTLESPLSFVPSSYPLVANKAAAEISALSGIVIDKNSKVTLYEKNSNFRFPPASTTKIMTALVALEHYSPSDILTIYEPYGEESILKLQEGEQFTFESLLYAMMLPSSNDATMSIAQNYPSGEKGFVQRMNEMASELRLLNTYYEDPVGLLDEKDYTTSFDLARLTAVALQNTDFAKVVSTKSKIITNTKGKEYKIENLNILLDLPGVNGVKTGTTPGAGQVLVTSKRLGNGQDLIFVVMQSQDRFLDTQVLLDYLNNNITYLSIHP